MAIISASNLEKSFGANKIISKASFLIEEKDKIGFVGLNGAGKSTLLKILAGKISFDSGDLSISKGIKIGYLSQDLISRDYKTVGELLHSVFEKQRQLEKQLRALEMNMSKPEIYEDPKQLKRLMDNYAKLQEVFKDEGGFEIQSRIRGVLNGLGFEDEDTPISTLSGGQKTSLALARILLEAPDLLLLDEPTNYLDIDSIQWLEGFLKDYPKAIVAVSHDRYFLDRIVTKIFELENTDLSIYTGNYTDYKIKKQKALKISEKHQELRQQEAERLKKSIQNFISHRNYKQADSRKKKLNELYSIPSNNFGNHGAMNIQMDMKHRSGNEVVTISDLCFSYDDKDILSNINLKVFRGERIGIIGPNGVGKSTILKIIAGMLKPQSGNIAFGHNVLTAYFAQEHGGLLPESTVLSEVWSVAPELSVTQIRTFLGNMLFSGEEVEKNIQMLSGGEKSRVSLAKAILQGANVLLLDEPTNHLDIVSKEKLEQALNQFDGTIIAVSHDRYFLSSIATRIWELDNGAIKDFHGDFNYYLEKIKEVENEKKNVPEPEENKTQQKKSRVLERKQREQKKQVEAKLKKLGQQILQKESELEKLEHMLCKPEVYSNPEKAKQVNNMYKTVIAELEDLYNKLA